MKQSEISNLIKEIIEKATVSVSGIEINEDKGGTTWFSVEVNEPHLFSSRGGEGLSALNHLVRRVLETKNPEIENRILIDVNGVQKRRVESIRATAHMMAERARYFKSNIEIDPMPAFERRIIHEFLQDATDLKTESMGEGSARRVVIKYISEI
jgi:spoIIIJ-associated protein